MPLFTRELNDLADRIGRSDLTMRLHTAVPTDGNPTNGRTTVGGGAYEAGVVLSASDLSDAMNGDFEGEVDINFGTADEAVGTVIGVSAYRGGDAVGYWTVATTVMGNGDSFKVNANTLDFMGSTS